MAFEGVGERFAVSNRREVALVSGAHGVNELFSLALPPLLPLLVAQFGLSYARAGLLVATYFGMYAVFQLPAGAVADRFGQGRLIWLGTAVMGVGLAVGSVAPTYVALLGAVAVAGVGGSTYHPAGMSLISDVEPDDTVGKAMGLHELAGMLGNLAAPLLVGGLAVATSWRLALGATGALGVGYAAAFAVLSARGVGFPAPDGSALPGPDRSAGSGHSAVSDYVTGSDHSADPECSSSDTEGGRAGPVDSTAPDDGERGVRAAVAEVVRVPLAWWVAGLFAAKLLFTLQTYGVRTYLTSYVAARGALTTGAANGVFFLFLAGSTVATVWFGAMADRFSRLHLLAGTFLVAAVAIAATALVPTSLVVLAVWFSLLGIAAYASLPVINTLVSEYADRAFSGSLFGVVQTASALGGTVSPLLFGEVASRAGIEVAFPSIALVCLVAGVGFVGAARRYA